MISPPMASYDTVSPAPLPFPPEDEEAFWQLFDGAALPDCFKFDGSGSTSRTDATGSCDTSANGPRTIESFLAAYATPAPSTVGATPHVTPTLPSAPMFAPTPAFTASPEAEVYASQPHTRHPSLSYGNPNASQPPPGTQRRELKRQRNTEASARFRLRKKQRENELESHAKHLEDEVVALRAEKSALERQVKVLLEVLGNVGRERREEAGESVGAPTPPPQ